MRAWPSSGTQGDTERALAAKASYLLSELLVKHPNMKPVVVREVEQLLFRPNVSARAQYVSGLGRPLPGCEFASP